MDVLPHFPQLSYFFLWVLLSGFSLHRLFLVGLYLRHKNDPAAPYSRFHDLPPVTIQLPLFNEKEVATRLLRAVAVIRYPRELLDIQVLDDSTDECHGVVAREVEILARMGVPIRHIHREARTGYKAGALRHGMEMATGDFIFILDADFLPPPDVLLESIHYFTDPGVGCVQMRWEHVNRDFSLLTRAQAVFLDAHFSVEHLARNRSGRFFNFNGTAGIWRRRCIEEAGGWEGDTLTEDLDLSYRAQLKGWRFCFLPHIAVPGELPVQAGAFKIQQYRWTKGSIQTCRKLLGKIWTAPIPLMTKIEATFHLTMNGAHVFLLLLLALLPVVFLQPARFDLFLFSLNGVSPLFFMAFASCSVFFLAGQMAVRRSMGNALKDLPFLLAIGVGLSLNNSLAALEGLFLDEGEFHRTPKRNVKTEERGRRWKRVVVSSSPLAYMELGAGGYFLSLICLAFSLERMAIMPILALFFFGFFYMGWNSWLHMERK